MPIVERELGETGARRHPVIFLGIPMAISVRDILRTDVFPTLLDAGVHVHLFSGASDVPEFRSEFERPGVTIHPLRRPRGLLFGLVDAVVLKFYVLALSLRCETARIMVSRTMELNPIARMARSLLRALGRRRTSALVRFGRNLTLKLAPDLYRDVFETYAPDLVVGTRVLTMSSQRNAQSVSYLDRYLIMAAAKREVKTAVMIPSWDNLSSKGFFPAEVDRVTVWNEIMEREARELHDLDPSTVVVTGAPQHDIYSGAPYSDRSDFLRGLGLDPERPVVMYATQTRGTVPEEPRIVGIIREALRKRFDGDVQLLVRLHQLDERDRYADIEGLDGVALDQAGRGSLGGYPDREFDRVGLERLADSLAHVDVVANAASSMSIDAAAVGTPVIGVAFDADPTRPYETSVRRYFDFTHQANVVASGGIYMVYSPEQMAEAVAEYLGDPALHREGRERLIREQCYKLDGRSGQRAAEAILEALGRSERHGTRAGQASAPSR